MWHCPFAFSLKILLKKMLLALIILLLNRKAAHLNERLFFVSAIRSLAKVSTDINNHDADSPNRSLVVHVLPLFS